MDETWTHGRQLATMEKTGETDEEWAFTYNADGLRTVRSDGNTTWEYIYNGSQLVQMTKGTDTLHFTYDASGTPLTVTHNGTVYYYVTNLQGDIIAILDSTGATVATYGYDAWGNPLNTPTEPIATLNPLRYRGYVYDSETGLYYLQSRYYDPTIGRFINADGLVSTGQGILGNNMYAYCGNNSVNRVDPTGYCYYNADGEWCHDAWEYRGGYKRQPDPGYYQGTTPTGLDVYVMFTSSFPLPKDSVVVIDKRDTNYGSDGKPNPDIQIINSYKYTDRADQAGILTLIYKYIVFNPSKNIWSRTEASLYIEWDMHNELYFASKDKRFKDADFDNNDEHMIGNFLKRGYEYAD